MLPAQLAASEVVLIASLTPCGCSGDAQPLLEGPSNDDAPAVVATGGADGAADGEPRAGDPVGIITIEDVIEEVRLWWAFAFVSPTALSHPFLNLLWQ